MWRIYYLGTKKDKPYYHNGSILSTTNVINTVVTSAAEAKYVSLYMNAKTAKPIRHMPYAETGASSNNMSVLVHCCGGVDLLFLILSVDVLKIL